MKFLILLLTASVGLGAEPKTLSLNGGIEDGKARLVIEAALQGLFGHKEKLLYSSAVEQTVHVSREKLLHAITVDFEALQGEPRELTLVVGGEGEIKNVTGELVLDWSMRRETNGVRSLVIRTAGTSQKIRVSVHAEAETKIGSGSECLTLGSPHPALLTGALKFELEPGFSMETTNMVGLLPVAGQSLAFRFHGAPYSLSLLVAPGDPEATRVVLRYFQLIGELKGDSAAFTMKAIAHVKNPRGGTLNLLSGNVALAGLEQNRDWKIEFRNGGFIAEFKTAGEFPITLGFNAPVQKEGSLKRLRFRLAPGVIAPVILRGLGSETQFEASAGARPERHGEEFTTFLPSDGAVAFSWKDTPAETEGKLFYSAEMLQQVSVGPGILRQTALVEGKVMQGELSRVTLNLRGEGNVVSVSGPQVLSWSIQPDGAERNVVVHFNQPQKESFFVQLALQRELGALPQAADVLQIRPEDATRVAGHLRIVNDGAVRLEIVRSSGLSQISTEQFPETEKTKALLAAGGAQRFAFRFSSADFSVRLQADNILPEVSVSELLSYHLGETELSIEGEFELDIREAPVREIACRIPIGYSIARLTAPGLNDYSVAESDLRLVFGQPISGRQVIQLRLERNARLTDSLWALPRIEVLKAKSTRGHIGVSADAGFRLATERTVGLTDIATAFFPRKLAGIQAAFRINDPAWDAALRVERLPQTIQADVFHLFSIGEGIAYGSCTMNFSISGAPVSTFLIALSDEYFNVEFTGKDLRNNWQRTTNGYLVTLNTPVAGPYTLLATYERPFKAQGDTLTFNGARPVDAQGEQGHTIVISAYQFQVTPVNVSATLTPLETTEVPAEYRLFFDAPILAAYRYGTRPFNLQLTLKPLAQSETLGLIVDRALLTTHISKEGEVITNARYFVKNRGQPNLRLTLPAGTTLWSATVNGANVAPVQDNGAQLIPLPQRSDPNAVQTLEFKLASRSPTPGRVTATAPIVTAPVLLAEWNLEPDTGRRLEFRAGSLAPTGDEDASGFAQLRRILRGAALQVVVIIGLVAFAIGAWRWATLDDRRVRRIGGAIGGILAILLAATQFATLSQMTARETATTTALTFRAPVQQSGSALKIDVANVENKLTIGSAAAKAWPALLALAVWIATLVRGRDLLRPAGLILGWTILAWAALRSPHGAGAFLALLAAFILVHVIVPALRAIAKPVAVAALLLLTANANAQTADSVLNEIRIEDQFAIGRATIRWQATNNEALPILFEPGVLTAIRYPTNSMRLVNLSGDRAGHQALALRGGVHEFTFEYQVSVTDTGFNLPTQPGLVNQITLTIPGRDVDVFSANAAAIQRLDSATNTTIVRLSLPPVMNARIDWKPRKRDARTEKTVFFAEFMQLYIPGAGAVEGRHLATIRPAQGQVSELTFTIPPGATVTDVSDSTQTNVVWRFDPDTRKLRVTLSQPRSGPFTLAILSQIATGPLPFEQTLGLISVEAAAGQLGAVGVATGNDVQLDGVTPSGLSPINLEDFASAAIAGQTLRRAFRYSETNATLVVKAAAVEPDVRVETQQTLSLSEDRSTLAIAASAEITRAGIFRLSFALPRGLDVETISAPAMSHWTELRAGDERIITLHLKSKTEGQQAFNITLTGPSVRAANNYSVPRVVFREATRQRGQIVIAPEQGMRLQVGRQENATQLDPQKAGLRQKGILAFRLLQPDWIVALDIEQVNAWVQVNGLQHTTISDAQARTIANLQYQIENTGLKSLRLLAPTNAESTSFRGDQVADFVAVPNSATNGLQLWEVKLHRRIIGKYQLQATWQTPLAANATNFIARGIQAIDANLQRGFLTLQASGRVQLRVATTPNALQVAEWQSIPRPLRQDLEGTTASYTFRLVEPAFQLPLALERHEAAKLLPARVNSVTLNSVISDEGVMLTQATLELVPGDKRLLHFTLPANASFWFAFVNQNGTWPWREGDQILIPLEQQSQPNKPTTVEIFYSATVGKPATRKLDLNLLGPKFDLPLENILWRVFIEDKWRLQKSTGSLQLDEVTIASQSSIDSQAYLQNEMLLNREKTKAAEEQLVLGNKLLSSGDPQQARRAFQNAFGMSAHDDAFNEDARVQLHNLKLQQAIVGLNVRQSAAGGENIASNVRDLRGRKQPAYTQQEARQLMDANSADENAAVTRLAERLVQQQDAAAPAPTAIRAAIPEQGRLLTFRRSALIDPFAELQLRLQAESANASSITFRAMTLAALFGTFLAFFMGARRQ